LVAWLKANPDQARSACPATAPLRILGVYS
jgi:hypothetical protein